MVIGSYPQSSGQTMFMIALVYCIVSLFNCTICLYCPSALRDIFHTSMARYSLFVLQVPLNTKQSNEQTTMPGVFHPLFV